MFLCWARTVSFTGHRLYIYSMHSDLDQCTKEALQGLEFVGLARLIGVLKLKIVEPTTPIFGANGADPTLDEEAMNKGKGC